MVAGANATGVDAIAGEYEWSMAGPPSVPGSAGNCPVPTANGGRTYVSIFFS